jgi:DnaK suppressor protein
MAERRAKAPTKKKAGLKSRPAKPKSTQGRAKTTAKKKAAKPKGTLVKKRTGRAKAAGGRKKTTPPVSAKRASAAQSATSTEKGTETEGKASHWPYEVPPQVRNPKLTAAKIREMRAMLESERERLVREITSLAGQNYMELGATQSNRFGNHMADVASDNQLLETILVQSGMEADRLRQVNEALDRIRRGLYGICERCGGIIGHERLMAKPFALFCIVCREIIEQGTLRRRR